MVKSFSQQVFRPLPSRGFGWVWILLAGFWSLESRGDVFINELHINPPGGNDGSFQYIELLTVDETGMPESQVLGDVRLVFLDSDGGRTGEVSEVINLERLTTGGNGLLLVGRRLDVANPWNVADETALVDLNLLRSGDGEEAIGPKDGLTALLVEGFAGSIGDDFDPNDDGQLARTPWVALLDSVGFGDVPYFGDLPAAEAPDHMSRIAGNRDVNSGSSWYGGNIVDTDGSLSLGIDDPFGSFAGRPTPGRPNIAELPDCEAPVRINEVFVNPPGTDDENVEFIELISVQGGVTSTDGLWILLLDSNRDGGIGTILEAWDLSGEATGANGLLLLGNNYRPNSHPWQNLVAPATTLFDPSGLGGGDIGPNQGMSMLLVRGFTGKANEAEGSGDDLDPNDDGTIDLRPWSPEGGENGILDSIGFAQLDDQSGEVIQATYAPADVTPVGADLRGFHPDSVFRKGGDLVANAAGAWCGGNIGGINATGISYRPDRVFGDFIGQVTPGSPNPKQPLTQDLILINELHLDPVGDPDGNFEYIELLSPNRSFRGIHDLVLLMVDASGFLKGEIRDVFDLGGLSTGPDGLLLIGDRYDGETTPYGSLPGLHRADPPGLDMGEIGPPDNNSLALLLVQGFMGTAGDDLDLDDDGFFDQSPWERVMDGVGFGGELKQEQGLANVKPAGIIPDSLSRVPGNVTPNSVEAWYGGILRGPERASVIFAAGFGPFRGQATPGRHNLSGPKGNAQILINEVHFNPPESDDRYEFVELLSNNRMSQTTNDLALLMIDNSGGRTGEILQAWNLDGLATGTDGILLLGDGYPPLYEDAGSAGVPSSYYGRHLFPGRLPQTPFGDRINGRVTAVGDPAGFDRELVGPNDGFALLLVSGFTGILGDDLDVDDDGQMDHRPWNQEVGAGGILDSVGFRRYDIEAEEFDGRAYALADVSQMEFIPDSIARHGDNLQPNETAAWYGGTLSGTDPARLTYTAETFGIEGRVTPGTPNVGSPIPPNALDDDADGFTNREEALSGTDPLNPDDFLHLTHLEHRSAAGEVVLHWRSVAGKAYHIEYSETLRTGTWMTLTSAPIVANGLNAMYVDDSEIRVDNGAGFYRLRVDTE